ncbi:MAG: hypothetical protein M1833_004870 [Piccolia ochrophora]|nr:MAG: hypothetical protein M1833_004870 [Piccolia ochrophora]
MPSAAHPSYIIVGAGVFGASTALELINAEPEARIVLIDRTSYPCPLAASHDYNKVVRADYGDLFYMRIALKARRYWKERPLYEPFFHECSLVNIDNTGLGRRMIENYKTLDEPNDATVVGPKDLKTKFDHLFEDFDEEDVHECYVNSNSGWAEAASAVQAVIGAAVEKGVKYEEASIASLTFDQNGGCTGVLTKDGRSFSAGRIILSTGAATAKLIADSAPDRPDIQVEDRLTAAAVITGVAKLTPEQAGEYKNIPVWIHSVGKTVGETMPIAPGGIMKITRDISFKNTYTHEASGQVISAPPDEPDYGQHTIPQGLRDEIETVKKGIYGRQVADLSIDSYRICWDAITPNQDFIISPHPRCPHLYIATGGSFHGWKFLPVLGEYVVQMLRGTLSEEAARRWAWDREQKGAAQGGLMPRRELRDIL